MGELPKGVIPHNPSSHSKWDWSKFEVNRLLSSSVIMGSNKPDRRTNIAYLTMCYKFGSNTWHIPSLIYLLVYIFSRTNSYMRNWNYLTLIYFPIVVIFHKAVKTSVSFVFLLLDHFVSTLWQISRLVGLWSSIIRNVGRSTSIRWRRRRGVICGYNRP